MGNYSNQSLTSTQWPGAQTPQRKSVIPPGKPSRPEVLVENTADLEWMVEVDNNISYNLKAIYGNKDKKDCSSTP